MYVLLQGAKCVLGQELTLRWFMTESPDVASPSLCSLSASKPITVTHITIYYNYTSLCLPALLYRKNQHSGSVGSGDITLAKTNTVQDCQCLKKMNCENDSLILQRHWNPEKRTNGLGKSGTTTIDTVSWYSREQHRPYPVGAYHLVENADIKSIMQIITPNARSALGEFRAGGKVSRGPRESHSSS